MILNLYQSKNLDGYLDAYFYQESRLSPDISYDPLYNWYANIMFVKRKKYLIITNGLTKFTFFIFRYTRKEFPFFEYEFARQLGKALDLFTIVPDHYLESIEGYAINERSNKSSMAHISRLKEEYLPLIKGNYHRLSFENDQAFFNKLVNERPTTYNKSTSYEYPYEVMKNELLKRGLL